MMIGNPAAALVLKLARRGGMEVILGFCWMQGQDATEDNDDLAPDLDGNCLPRVQRVTNPKQQARVAFDSGTR